MRKRLLVFVCDECGETALPRRNALGIEELPEGWCEVLNSRPRWRSEHWCK